MVTCGYSQKAIFFPSEVFLLVCILSDIKDQLLCYVGLEHIFRFLMALN